MSDIILLEHGQVSQTGLALPENLSFEDWLTIGEKLGKVTTSIQWLIGDWWNFGGHSYGSRAEYIHGGGWNGLSYNTCKKAGWVCGKFEMVRRRTILPFSYYQEVASLESDKAHPLLDWCEQIHTDTGKLPGSKLLRQQAQAIREAQTAAYDLETCIEYTKNVHGVEITPDDPNIQAYKTMHEEKFAKKKKPPSKKTAIKALLNQRPDLVESVSSFIRKELHPDKPNGDKEQFQAMQKAIETDVEKYPNLADKSALALLVAVLKEEQHLIKLAATYLLNHAGEQGGYKLNMALKAKDLVKSVDFMELSGKSMQQNQLIKVLK